MKKTVSVILCIVLMFSFASMSYSGCQSYKEGDVNNDGKINISDARLTLRAVLKKDTLDSAAFTAADINCDGKVTYSDARLLLRCAIKLIKVMDIPYAQVEAKNVSGYPKKEGSLILRKLIVNGNEARMVAYTHGSDTSVIYVSPCYMCWSFICGIDATSCSRTVNNNTVGAFAARINGHLVHNSTTEAVTYIDGKEYADATPEYYKDDFYCSTLMFEKTLHAKVELSPDGSAVYITTDRVDEANSIGDDVKIDPDGTNFRYDENFKPVYEEEETDDTAESEEETTKKSEESTTKSSSNPSWHSCSACGGQGKTYCSSCSGRGYTQYMQQVMNGFDPVTMAPRYSYQMQTIVCASCSGTGSRRCSICGGTGQRYY